MMTGKTMNDVLIQHGVLKTMKTEGPVIEIPKGVREIGYRAFLGRSDVEEVVIPEGVEQIAGQAFLDCRALKKVTFPSSLREISYSVFENCTSLSEVILPEGLVHLDRMVFLNCENLKTISFPDTLREVGWDALRGTAWLSDYPEGVVFAGRLALFAKGAVTKAEIRPGTVKICVNAFRGNRTLSEVLLPEGLEIIEDRAFQECRKLHRISIPQSVREIGTRAFDECNRLEVDLHAKKATVKKGCFADSAKIRLTHMDPTLLPDNVRLGAVLAFAEDCANQKELDPTFFVRMKKYIKSRRKLLYTAALEHWDLLQFMIEQQILLLEDVDEMLEVLLDDDRAEATAALMQYKNTMLSGEDAQEDLFDAPDLFADPGGFDDLTLEWDLPEETEKTEEDLLKEWGLQKKKDGTFRILSYHGRDREVRIPGKIGEKMITSVSPYALSPDRYGMKRETADVRRQIRSVTVAEGITVIGNHAFAGCESLEEVHLPESVIEIQYEAFLDCKRLSLAELPESVEVIGRAAFQGCQSLSDVTVPQEANVAEDAFFGTGMHRS